MPILGVVMSGLLIVASVVSVAEAFDHRPMPCEPKAGEGIKLVGDEGKVRNLYYSSRGQWVNVTRFTNPHHIDQYGAGSRSTTSTTAECVSLGSSRRRAGDSAGTPVTRSCMGTGVGGVLVAKFNIVLELGPLDGGEPVRVLAAFALIPETKRIRLLTLFG
jgi:hypothetical protein